MSAHVLIIGVSRMDAHGQPRGGREWRLPSPALRRALTLAAAAATLALGPALMRAVSRADAADVGENGRLTTVPEEFRQRESPGFDCDGFYTFGSYSPPAPKPRYPAPPAPKQ